MQSLPVNLHHPVASNASRWTNYIVSLTKVSLKKPSEDTSEKTYLFKIRSSAVCHGLGSVFVKCHVLFHSSNSGISQNVKAFASSDSLAKVQEVASWLLEMNQELLSVGSKRRRTGGSLRGNASSSQVDEEQMNRVVEEEEQQQRRQQEEQHIGRNGEIGGEEPGFDDRHESQQEQLEENNNRLITVDEESTCNQEEDDDEHAGDQEEEVEEEEEMDQESDDFDQSDDSSREDEHANSNSVTNSNSLMDLPIHQSSPFYTKTKCWPFSSVLCPQAVLLQDLFGELGSGNRLWELFLIHGVTLFLIVLTVYLKEQHR
ncbi:F-box/WD repeat-containing protein 7 isoform X4 [Cygnus atratus]|uniref:F-box/WD repeat-containing protein 7 isoform X4 n=1 Tax=Cygnus atratus TaxID=8868 RepID=UPI0015D5BB5E|nr:F-box/WD repeat-containing protein 7 isoform X4 [Cygnus atratus]